MSNINRNILLIDDEINILSAFKRMILKEDINLLTISDPEEAINLIRRQSFAVVISDRFMPKKDGLSFLNEVKCISPDTMRIMLTGSSDIQTVVSAINIGEVYRFILKPWSEKEVIHLLRESIDQFNLKSEIRRLHHELKISYQHLQNLQDHKDMLVSMIVHDIRGPLTITENVIQTFSDQIKSLNIQDTSIREITQIGLDCVNETLLLTNSLLDLSKLESGKMIILSEECNLSNLLSELAISYTHICKRELKLILADLPSIPVIVKTDEIILKRVIQNLIGNAIKFTLEGGTIKVGVRQKDTQIEIFVSDNGPGISKDKLPAIFDKYIQAGTNKNEKSAGVGLGLAFCKLGVEALSGIISVSSEINCGTCFTIR